MKILELYERIGQVDATVNSSTFGNADWDKVGAGAQADVYSHQGKPGTVTKVAHIKDTEDATYKFIELAMAHQDNPYFPRINSAKVYNSDESSNRLSFKDSKNVLIINMERLIPVKNQKIRQMLPVLFNQIGIKSEKGGTEDVSKNDLDSLGTQLWELFGSPEGRKQIISDTKIPELKEALTLTSNLIESNPDFRPDLHEDNVMIRLTGSGPQLVIVDPAIS